MTFEDFSRFLNTKSIGRTEPIVNEQLTERTYTGMKKIGKDTLPLKWVVDDPTGHSILRRVDDFTYVRFPKKPQIGSGEQLDIEDELLDALALYVMAGLETQRSKVLMGMYREEMDQNNTRLTETYLGTATNDAERYHVFP